MRAFMPNSFAPAMATTGPGRDEAAGRRLRRALALARRAATLILIGLAAAAAIIGVRILIWAIGHPHHPFFQEIAKLWG
jgi:hypothetical protein